MSRSFSEAMIDTATPAEHVERAMQKADPAWPVPAGPPVSDQDRRTPPWLVKTLETYLGRRFTLDAAASKQNAVCRRFYDAAKNGLAQPWVDGTFCNPPFKRFGEWIEKAYNEATRRQIEVCVIGPVGASQTWFHALAAKGTVLAPDERISYFDSATGAPTRGADRDTHVFLFGPRWWNKQQATSFRVLPLAVRGQVVRATKVPAA